MDLCSKIPLFAISLVLLSSLGFPLTVFRPETWGFTLFYRALAMTVPHLAQMGGEWKERKNEENNRGLSFPFLDTSVPALGEKVLSSSEFRSLGLSLLQDCWGTGEKKNEEKRTNKQTKHHELPYSF